MTEFTLHNIHWHYSILAFKYTLHSLNDFEKKNQCVFDFYSNIYQNIFYFEFKQDSKASTKIDCKCHQMKLSKMENVNKFFVIFLYFCQSRLLHFQHWYVYLSQNLMKKF